MRVEVRTCNSTYENGECVGGYYETHTVKCLSNVKHVIATVESIVKNNLLYGCIDTVLEEIYISCEDIETSKELEKYFKKFPMKVMVEYVYS